VPLATVAGSFDYIKLSADNLVRASTAPRLAPPADGYHQRGFFHDQDVVTIPSTSATSATTIIRFQATSDPGNDDIGIDNAAASSRLPATWFWPPRCGLYPV
jgi:hypothetical protein